jgi:hypothetical protein
MRADELTAAGTVTDGPWSPPMQSIVSFTVMECDEFQAQKRQLNAAFLLSQESVKRTSCPRTANVARNA